MSDDTDLEKDFEVECRRLLDEAAQKVREATKLAEDHGADLPDLWDAHRGLRNAMDEAGWSTSSLSC